jgi:alpha-L-arabinofuranosidase
MRAASSSSAGMERDLAATLDLGGAGIGGLVKVWEVNGPDVGATNSFETPRAVDVRERQAAGRGPRLEYVFPAQSVTVLRIDAA